MGHEKFIQISGHDCTTIIFPLTKDRVEYVYAMNESMQITLINIIGQFKCHLPNNVCSAK